MLLGDSSLASPSLGALMSVAISRRGMSSTPCLEAETCDHIKVSHTTQICFWEHNEAAIGIHLSQAELVRDTAKVLRLCYVTSGVVCSNSHLVFIRMDILLSRQRMMAVLLLSV